MPSPYGTIRGSPPTARAAVSFSAHQWASPSGSAVGVRHSRSLSSGRSYRGVCASELNLQDTSAEWVEKHVVADLSPVAAGEDGQPRSVVRDEPVAGGPGVAD